MFPTNPTINQTFSLGSRTYMYTGTRWEIISSYSQTTSSFGVVPSVYDNSLIPDDDEATIREKTLRYGNRVYQLSDGKWVISVIGDVEVSTGTQGLDYVLESLSEIADKISDYEDKFISIDERFSGIPTSDGGYVLLESNTVPGETTTYESTVEFFDDVIGGDVNIFKVSLNQRGTYSLNGVPQPTVEVPVPDLMKFDLEELPEDDYENFDIFDRSGPLSTGILRDYPNKWITVNTSQISSSVDRIYYRHRFKKGLGFTISIVRY